MSRCLSITWSLLSLHLFFGASAMAQNRADCMKMHKGQKLDEAIACYTRLLKPEAASPEIYRLRGSAHALNGDRTAAYADYKAYVEKCPDCAMANSVRKILHDYESRAGMSDPPPGKASDSTGDGERSAIGAKRETRARALLDKAEALKRARPHQARQLTEQAAGLLPSEHILWERVRALRAELLNKSGKPSRR